MCCFTKFCMTLEELGRFILRRIYHLRIIPRMIFPRKNYFPRTVSTENIIYLNECTDVAKHAEYTCSNIRRTINDV